MRLVERISNDEFRLTTELYGNNVPRYAVLSHTWGSDDEEFSFNDMVNGSGKHKEGYKKIQFCGERAALDNLSYFWVDTCCIEKSNSVLLSEAFNSMFKWYHNATKCYVYLADVSYEESSLTWELAFRQSRWFTRGWTLQELVAPIVVEFYTKDGKLIGDKTTLERQICEVTGIPVQALRGDPPSLFGITERMSWAARRATKREEDQAYCLFGLFELQLPVLYGEGKDNAMFRLLEEIEKRSKNFNRERLSRLLGVAFQQPSIANHEDIATKEPHEEGASTMSRLLNTVDSVDSNAYYKIENPAYPGFAIDVVNDGRQQNVRRLDFTFEDRFSGQLWRLRPSKTNTSAYNLSTMWLGTGMCLDVSYDKTTPHLAPEALVTGQHWRLRSCGNATWMLSNHHSGILVLSVNPDTGELCMTNPQRSSSALWTLRHQGPIHDSQPLP